MLLESLLHCLKNRFLEIGFFVLVFFGHVAILYIAIQPSIQPTIQNAVQQNLTRVELSQFSLIEKNSSRTEIKKNRPVQPESPKVKISESEPKLVSKLDSKPVAVPNVKQPTTGSALNSNGIKSKSATQESNANTVTLPSTKATASSNIPPNYPRLSKRLNEQGTVILQLTVKKNGETANVTVHTSSGYKRLDEAALNAVKKWHYEPATKNGKPIQYIYLQPVKFALQYKTEK